MVEPDRYEAKLRFANAFVELVSEMPVERITVGHIANRAHKNRKTFYYHFADKNELPRWLFRHDIAIELEKFFPREELVFNAKDESDSCADMPFYARNIMQDGTINNAMFFEIFSHSLEKHRSCYRQLFTHVGPDSLDNYLHKIYTPCIKEDIWYLIDRELVFVSDIDTSAIKRSLEHSAAVDFLAEFFTGSFISRIIMRIHYAGQNRSMYDIAPFENVIHESLQLMISKHIQSMARRF